MTSFGAYEDEMRGFLRLSDEELARLLAGEAAVGDEAFEEVASLLNEARTTFATAPDAATRADHIAAISEASQLLAENGNPAARLVSKIHGPVGSQVSGLPKWRSAMKRTLSVALKVVAGTMAASLSMVGLAYAGVDLPGQAAEQAFGAVTGLELPNQGPEADSSVADDVRTVLDGDLEGCELGQAVADAADASRKDEAATETDPCTQNESHDAQGSKATGDEKSAEGRAKAEEGQSNNPSGEGADSGDAKAEEGQSNNPSGEGADSGDAKAEEGQSNNPTDRP